MVVSFPILGQAEDLSREQISEYGFIDWLNQKVYANGVGIAPKDKQNQTQAKTLAYRAAVVVAQRNLLEVIKGVHINSETILEDRIVTDDIIVSKIEGVVKFSQVESSQLLENNAVSVTLSMPLTGRMGEVLIRAIEGTAKPSPTISAPQNMNDRLHRLETRVAALENKLSRLNEISVEQKSVMHLLTYLVEAWQNDTDRQARILKVGFASEEETAALGYQIDEQNKQMASMSIHLKNLSRRLAALENSMSTGETSLQSEGETSLQSEGETSLQSETRKTAYPYTGLIVDARDTGFKPSLRPELYHQGELIYPGDYLNLSKTVQSGYVRYFNSRFQAQQSDRMGSLPLATKATGTAGGDRGLSIDNETSKILKAVLQEPDNFMVECRVVIIF